MKFCSLSSSSYANSVLVQDEHTCILIDCGLRKRDIKPFLNSIGLTPGDIDAVLVTHSHTDHVYGLNYLLAEKNMPVYSTAPVLKELTASYKFRLSPNFMPLQEDQATTINSITVTPLGLSHDVATIGFKVVSGQESLGFMTDTGYVPEKCLQAFQATDYLYIESNHDVELYRHSTKPFYVKKRNLGPNGHLSNEQCGQALGAMNLTNCQLVVLAHLSEQDNEPRLAFANARQILPEQTRLATAPARRPGNWSAELLK